MTSFWVHSFASRRERDQAEQFKLQRQHAALVLAGWVFVEDPDWAPMVEVIGPGGRKHGRNYTLADALNYADQFISTGRQLPWR